MNLYLDIVSLKKRIFSDFIKKVRVSGSEGELGIYPKHAQLLSIIKPGIIYISHINNKKEECLYISGGILEVQPYVISILADVVIHATDLNREDILQTKKNAEEHIKSQHEQSKKDDILLQISKEIAKLRALEMMDKFK